MITYENYDTIKAIALKLFNVHLKNIFDKEQFTRIGGMISHIHSRFELSKITFPRVVDTLNEEIFTRPELRDFYLNYLDHLSLEIHGLGNDIFKDLITYLAESTVDCKYKRSSNRGGVVVNSDLEPILESLAVNKERVIETYQSNPWLVAIVLIHTQLLDTEIGEQISNQLK